MCFKNSNLQADSKVKTCKDCIDEKTLNSISCWIVSFYLFLVAIPVSAVFIFNEFNKINKSIVCKVTCFADFSICSFVCSFVDYIGINFNACIFVCTLIYAGILFLCIRLIYSRYFKPQKTKCKEIYDDLKVNRNVMAWSAACVVVCLLIPAFISSDYVTKITVYLALLLVTCFIGFRAKYYNKKYALTKIYIDYMPTSSKYLTIGEREEERELLVIKKSFLRYYKTMETNYLMMSAFFAFVTSVLGMSSIDSLKSVSMLFVLNMAM